MNYPNRKRIRRTTRTALATCILLGSTLAVAAQEQEETIFELNPFEVVTARDVGYLATNAITGARVNTAIRDLPIQMTVLTRELLEDLNVTDIEGALDYTVGVERANEFIGQFVIRGMAANGLLRNGQRATPFSDLSNVERVEILRGPNSVFYGRSDPGGTVNIITKRPLQQPFYSLSFQFGEWDFYRLEADATGPIDQAGKFAYRALLGYTDAGGFRDFEAEERKAGTLSLRWQPTNRTYVNIDYSYFNRWWNDAGQWPNFVDVNPERPGELFLTRYVPVGLIPRTFSWNGPDGFRELETHSYYLEAFHRINETFSLRLNMHYIKRQDNGLFASRNGVWPEEENLIRTLGSVQRFVIPLRTRGREVRAEATDIYRKGGQLELLTEKELSANLRTRIVSGVEYHYTKSPNWRTVTSTARTEFIITNPVYNTPNITAEYQTTRWFREKAAYVIAQWFAFNDKLIILSGLRWDEIENMSLVSPGVSNERNSDTQDQFSPQLGANYRLTENITLFANYSESFTPQWARTEAGTFADPFISKGYEFGTKSDFFDGRLSFVISLYELEKQGAYAPLVDPITQERTDAYQRERSRGFEFESVVTYSRALQFIMGYTYIDAILLENPAFENALRRGDPIWNVPQPGRRLQTSPHQFSFTGKYTFVDGFLEGLFGTATFTYRQKRPLQPVYDFLTEIYVPGRETIDLTIGYRFSA